jgi:hypothetical protein
MIQVFDSSTDRTAEIAETAAARTYVAPSDRSVGPPAVYPAAGRIEASAF